jgi:hypothetical protein
MRKAASPSHGGGSGKGRIQDTNHLSQSPSADPGQHEALARQAHQLGRTSGDRHLELCALTQIGVALIDQGRITEGVTFHDEAMAGALAGEGELDTVVFTACD